MKQYRMNYLNQLIRIGAHPLKRARWLHFCRHCRADLSAAPPYADLCLDCARRLVAEILDELVIEGKLRVECDAEGTLRYAIAPPSRSARASGGA